MGSFSIWHWIILLVILSIPVFIGLVIWLVIRATRKPAAGSVSTTLPAISSVEHSPTEARLLELRSLRSKGLITDAEFEQQRSAILRSV
ncbi:SHOCT domain-containing protein [Arenimonas metalli]|uniref:SHOCT domain-containing protein n=1 Tax=Arenimonas metalli TaxID=948077 RepID=UPI000A040730|nr:SHOCT domain-containing protein [Arenimonas metalli]